MIQMKADVFTLPLYIHRRNIREHLGHKRWRMFTNKIRKSVNYICDNCKTDMRDHINRLHSHEDWLLDFNNKVAELIEIRVLCNYCHMFYHQGRYNMLRFKGKINDEEDKIIRQHWKTYPQKGYNIIISEENKKFIDTITNSYNWTIKPFDDTINKIMNGIGQKTIFDMY